MTEHDLELQRQISTMTDNPKRLAELIREYYIDLDRAERTSRETMYFHLGLVCGAIGKLCDWEMGGLARHTRA